MLTRKRFCGVLVVQVQLLSVSVHRELEEPLHSSVSLSEDSKKELGLSCEQLSTLPPKPEDKLLLQDRENRGVKRRITCAGHLCSKLYLSQSNAPGSLASNKLTQLEPVLWMASATVYFVLPRAHLSIFAILRSDWRKRWSRLSDNSRGVWTTLEERDRRDTQHYWRFVCWIKSLSPDEWTYFSKNSCKPLILWKTWPVFLKLKNRFQGGSLGISLETIMEKKQWVKNQTDRGIRGIKGIHQGYIHDQGIVFKTVSQPNKLIVSSLYRGSLLSKAHAVCLQSTQKFSQLEKKIPKEIKRRGILTCKEIS